jgi:hypothetical protein
MIDFLSGIFQATLAITAGLWIWFVRTPREEGGLRHQRQQRTWLAMAALGILALLMILDGTVASTTFLARLTFPTPVAVVLLAPFWLAAAIVFLTSIRSRL